jgi:hypothetical protein
VNWSFSTPLDAPHALRVTSVGWLVWESSTPKCYPWYPLQDTSLNLVLNMEFLMFLCGQFQLIRQLTLNGSWWFKFKASDLVRRKHILRSQHLPIQCLELVLFMLGKSQCFRNNIWCVHNKSLRNWFPALYDVTEMTWICMMLMAFIVIFPSEDFQLSKSKQYSLVLLPCQMIQI